METFLWEISIYHFVFLLSAAYAYEPYADCGSEFLMDNLTIASCNDDNPGCNLYIGENTTISFMLDSGEFVMTDKNLISEAYVTYRGANFHLKISPSDYCSVAPCPFDTHYSTNYTATVYVDISYIALPESDLTWKISTGTGEQLLCFKARVTLRFIWP